MYSLYSTQTLFGAIWNRLHFGYNYTYTIINSLTNYTVEKLRNKYFKSELLVPKIKILKLYTYCIYHKNVYSGSYCLSNMAIVNKTSYRDLLEKGRTAETSWEDKGKKSSFRLSFILALN